MHFRAFRYARELMSCPLLCSQKEICSVTDSSVCNLERSSSLVYLFCACSVS